MDEKIKNHVGSYEFGGKQRHKNMVVFPIMMPHNGGPDYMTLKEALEKAVFVVTEVSEGGTVPNLKVFNKADVPVLLLDGEELAGAKQNRVLNTTILVNAGVEIVIPVSCTEQGRWSYASRELVDSGNVMSPKLRTMNRRAVAASLESSHQFHSDQYVVWEQINYMSIEAGANSETGAMKDVFEARKSDLDAYLKSFTCESQQKGLLVMIGGEVVGFDYISRENAFGGLFPKLVKSYAMEAWLASRKQKGAYEVNSAQEASKAAAFMASVKDCGQKSYDSVGMGLDVRFEGKGLVGSALVVDDKLVHMAFFSVTDSEKAGNMAGLSRRRSFRSSM
jgi:hypothetical protein